MPTAPTKPLIVISYAREDEPEKPAEGEAKWLSFVTGYLRPAIKHGAVDLWLDRLMPGGADWEREIEQKLRVCDIFILLVSRHSLSSDYVVDKEIAIIRERQAKGEPVHFYPLVLTPTPKIALELVRDKNLRPRDDKPLSDYPPHERYRQMNEAADEIAAIAAGVVARGKSGPPVSPAENLPAGLVQLAMPDDVSSAIAKITDRASLEAWLRKQPRETAVTIAARAALRVAPLVGKASREIDHVIGATFRATALSLAAGKNSARASELRAALAPFADVDDAAALAVDDAFVAAFAADIAAAAFAAASAVAYASFVAFATALDAAGSDALWHEVRFDADAASRDSSRAMADRPLWSKGQPNWVADHWAKLQAALSKGQDWDVWIAWYNDRLRGVSRGEAYDLVFATVPDAEWDKGSASANAWIKAHLPPLASV